MKTLGLSSQNRVNAVVFAPPSDHTPLTGVVCPAGQTSHQDYSRLLNVFEIFQFNARSLLQITDLTDVYANKC